MEFRSAYDGKNDAVSEASGLECKDESLALQSQKEEVDINTIVKRFGVTGVLPQGARVPQYGDFTTEEPFDFRVAMDRLKAAEDSFMALAPEIRARFNHDPLAFVEFCSNRDNLPELRKMGLAVPEAEKANGGHSTEKGRNSGNVSRDEASADSSTRKSEVLDRDGGQNSSGSGPGVSKAVP